MDSTAMTDHVADQDWLEPIADTLQKSVTDAYAAAGPAGKPVKNFFHGVWLGHSLHQALVNVPLGAWTATIALDALEAVAGRKDLAPGADAALAVGLIGAVGAALSGLTDYSAVQDKKPKRTGAAHALLNIGATVLFTSSWLLRRSGKRGLGQAVSTVGFFVTGVSAYLGGSLVTEQKIGVDHAPREGTPKDFVAVLAEADLPEGKLTRVEAEGVPIVLVRQGDTVSALAAACSHLGGPLDEGTLDGGCVRCPWHGSLFSFHDGAVLEGPATFPQPTYETRVQNGQIELRAVSE